MLREWTIRIEDILESIAKIQRYLKGMDFGAFVQDDRTIDAVIRNFGIIGEAASHVPEDVRESRTDIPWNQIREWRLSVALVDGHLAEAGGPCVVQLAAGFHGPEEHIGQTTNLAA